ncbi:MAG: hypothetical protein JSS60_07170 [Verrucomicrobia bacterium]|nr:hypothetical protein [Verrucomicrobiota bacterium]
MNRIFLILALALLCSCSSKNPSNKSDAIVSMQIIDRNGFTETISNKERLSSYQATDFMEPQPYQKVLRVYGRNSSGQSTSKITSYHENGGLWQYLEVVDGRAHGVFREWFSNGKQKIEAKLIEGVADIHELAQATWVFQGPCKVWDDQGILVAQFNYEKGVLHNPALYYFPSGKLQKSIPYENGDIHGIAQTFDENGNLIEEIAYIKGEKEGRAVAYWTSDRLKSEEFFEHGRLATASYFDPAGNCVAQVKGWKGKQAQFKDGNLQALFNIANGITEGEMQFFHPNGALHCTYVVKDGKKNGEEWEYFPTDKSEKPKPKLFVHWSDDKIQGQVKTWYKNGQMESQREINNNKKQGTSFAWYKSGDLMMVEEYENDLLVKGSYYKKGDKKAVTKVESGKGIASLYTSDGIFMKKVSYEKGKPLLANDSIH